MAKPTPKEIEAFLVQLRIQGSFLMDPAILAAADFIERLIAAPQSNSPAYDRTSQDRIAA